MKLSDFDEETLRTVKKMGFTDAVIAKYVGCDKKEVTAKRKELGICAVIKWLIPVPQNLRP